VLDAARTVGLREVVIRRVWGLEWLRFVAMPPSYAGLTSDPTVANIGAFWSRMHKTGDRLLLQ
jgi:hypothetical protein